MYGRQLVAGDAGGNSFAERFDMVPFLIVIGKDWQSNWKDHECMKDHELSVEKT